MTSKEVIKRVINRNNPPRIGYDFTTRSDIAYIRTPEFLIPEGRRPEEYAWGRHAALLKYVPRFNGEVRLDALQNIYGRLDGLTKGECIKGSLEDWESLDSFKTPAPDPAHYKRLREAGTPPDKYVVALLQLSPFSALRDTRLMVNALTDTLLEPDNVSRFLSLICGLTDGVCQNIAGIGVDAVMLHDDWGTQESTFISEESFVKLFKPAYARIAQSAKGRGMDLILHSCGKNHLFIPHLIEAGVDVFQFDQPDIYPAEWLAKNFGGKAAFFCPADIQRVMPTGNKALIQNGARALAGAFIKYGGGFIAKDYTPWSDICVKEEWAEWAREAFLEYANE